MARWCPFGSRDTTPPTASGGPSEKVPAPVAPTAPTGDRPGLAWRALPVLQRAVGTLEPVTSMTRFSAGLASHRSPAFLAPLGHLVDPAGPSGEVTGLLQSAAPQAVQRVP